MGNNRPSVCGTPEELALIIRISGKEIRLNKIRQLALEDELFNRKGDYLTEILTAEYRNHFRFFDRIFSLREFSRTLRKYGQEKIQLWKSYGLEPHFLPGLVMQREARFPGWIDRPTRDLYRAAARGHILARRDGRWIKITDIKLPGKTVLVDKRSMPMYDQGKQMFEDDNLMGPILEQLRSNGDIDRCKKGPPSSRFNVWTHCRWGGRPWEDFVCPPLAELLGLDPHQLRSERGIEVNVIPQLYPHLRIGDRESNTAVFFQGYNAGAGRLCGGVSYLGVPDEVRRYPEFGTDAVGIRLMAIL